MIINEMLKFEKEAMEMGYKLIAGMDEAGRGPLAGPVCVASVILPLEQNSIIEGVNDSKKLTEKKREELFEKIINKAVSYSITFCSEKEIDKINILNATKSAMQTSIKGLNVKPDYVLIDAVKLNLEIPNKPIIHGDAQSYLIAAASILAKVSRDHMMQELDKKYPNYNFGKHKGYGTKEHIENLKNFGPCEIHRKTFIKNFVAM